MHQRQRVQTRTRQIVSRALVAVALAGILVASAGDDILRLTCIALGPSNPLYDILGCPLIVHPGDPEG